MVELLAFERVGMKAVRLAFLTAKWLAEKKESKWADSMADSSENMMVEKLAAYSAEASVAVMVAALDPIEVAKMELYLVAL